MHRNTRRRPFRPFGYYFITTNVSQGFILLGTDVFGHLLAHTIHLAAHITECRVIAYKINSDHIHIIVQIAPTKTISDFMGSMKLNFSRGTNSILARNFKSQNKRGFVYPGEDSNLCLVGINKFKWQYFYHSHLITSKRDFDNHVRYIRNQHIKHKLSVNKFCFVDKTHKFRYRWWFWGGKIRAGIFPPAFNINPKIYFAKFSVAKSQLNSFQISSRYLGRALR